ncbi:amidohydrolase [Oleiharenicola lentus]|uniref:Amidohydrolase n=1 Tax=Oleiharenicola lentus TaxID=2508720 RepID=A0A4Q1C909_9BACT|nr:amidohydrolase family protein [Oleiharenicola lentus]RXK55356.1 amidohydrolase [Oleiharenicola lentus]
MKINARLRLLLLACLLAPALRAAETLAILGDTVHTLTGAPLTNGVVLLRDGKIEAVGPAATLPVPAGYRVVRAAVVTPGLIDAHGTVGLSGLLNQPHDQDMLERSAAIQPELRAIDAYNAKDPLVAWVRSFGVTTVNTGHAPRALVSGQTMIVKTFGRTTDEDVIVPAAMTSVTLGADGLAQGDGAGPGAPGKSPGNRSKAIAMLRAELIKTQEYARKLAAKDETKRPDRDLKYETLLRALDGSQPLLVTANRHQDILSALRVAQEFNLRIILDGCADALLVLPEIKASGFPVIVHPTMQRSFGDMENLSMETAAKLHAAGVPIALQSSYEAYVPKTRVVLFEAAEAAAQGLGFEAALASITRGAARILGIDSRTGALAAGLDADLALFDGDPFEYTTHCTGTIIGGRLYAP